MFEDMEILLMDDGSSDEETLGIIKRLTREYENIKSYFFPIGGSGSALRPRNKGIELAQAKYVTFLDPDNMVINDGYTKLYNELEGTDNDFIISDHLMVKNTKEIYCGAYDFNRIGGSLTLRSNLIRYNLQSMMCKRDFLQKQGISAIKRGWGEKPLYLNKSTVAHFGENQ